MIIYCLTMSCNPNKERVGGRKENEPCFKPRKLCCNPDKFMVAKIGLTAPDKPLWAIKAIEAPQAMFVTKGGKYNVIGVSEERLSEKNALANLFTLVVTRRDNLKEGDIFAFYDDVRKPEDITQECLRMCLSPGFSVRFKEGGVSKDYHADREKEMVWKVLPMLEKQ